MIDELKTEFANFWQDTQGKIRAYMLCACGNPSDADDLVQQCYLRAFKNWEKYNGTGSRYAWLFTIARRTCVDFFRTKKDYIKIDFENLSATKQAGAEKSFNDETELIWQVVRGLKTELRDVISLRFASGLSYAEIAQTLDIPIGTVRSRLHRSLSIIHDKIKVNENE
ncbi:MAG: sigma-70 family RNA polymerase sigma factor [Sedimentisphaerales bacterium]|nr:sigma-70 family RNA polymerase sigma factor [Sedimentisphaerales bacterium]